MALKENKKIVGYAICVNKYDSRVNMKKAVLVDLMLLEKEQFTFRSNSILSERVKEIKLSFISNGWF